MTPEVHRRAGRNRSMGKRKPSGSRGKGKGYSFASEVSKVLGNWPSAESLRDASLLRNLNEWELLALKSRSFYAPIRGLSAFRGSSESDKGNIVAFMYNWLRLLDTAEDGALNFPDKIRALNKVGFIVNECASNGSDNKVKELKENEIPLLTALISQGAVDEDEKIFVRKFLREDLLQSFYDLDKPVKELISHSVKTMMTGMAHFQERGNIVNENELVDYCGYVAGDIGIDLSKLVKLKDGVELDLELARNFGISLQLTNIAKNKREDEVVGRVDFWPDSYGVGVEAFRKLEDLQKNYLEGSISYLASIPLTDNKRRGIVGVPGYASFVLSPYLSALETWRVMGSNPEGVLRGDEDAIKMKSGVYPLIIDTSFRLTRPGNDRNYKRFLEDIVKNPGRVNYKPKEHTRLMKEYS